VGGNCNSVIPLHFDETCHGKARSIKPRKVNRDIMSPFVTLSVTTKQIGTFSPKLRSVTLHSLLTNRGLFLLIMVTNCRCLLPYL